MKNGIHFISGMPRSGSTLLSALLRQNPRIHAAMTSPVGGLVNSMLRAMSQENETAIFIEDEQRERILRGIVDGFYADLHPSKLIFDTNRGWTSKLALLTRLFPEAKVICCVRSPAWVLDSLETLARGNPLEPSGIYKWNTVSNVYSRAEQVMSGDGMVGHPLHCLREAVFDPRRSRLLLVRYESLTREPVQTLGAIYDFIGEAPFAHDPETIEQDWDAIQFDGRLGAPGLHTVGSRVRSTPRPTLLPPDLFHKYDGEAFWERKKEMPEDVRVL